VGCHHFRTEDYQTEYTLNFKIFVLDYGSTLPSVTQWTVADDTTDRVTYYYTAWNRQVRKIDLNKIDFAEGDVRKRPIDAQQAQNVKDVTEDLR
jgi:penicillin V acylase-like amidase (Ntn superfamily)